MFAKLIEKYNTDQKDDKKKGEKPKKHESESSLSKEGEPHKPEVAKQET